MPREPPMTAVTPVENAQGDVPPSVNSYAEQIAKLTAALEAQGKLYAEQLAQQAAQFTAALQAVMTSKGPVEAPVVPAREAVTMADLFPRYLRSLGNVTWLPVATAQMRHVLAWFAPSAAFRAEEGRRRKVPVHGPDMNIADMRAYHWTDFRDWMRRELPRISPQVRDLILIRTRTMLNWAVGDERIAANPFADVKKEHKLKKRGTRIMDDSVEKFRQAGPSRVAWAYLLAICDGGMRPGEARLLQWSQIDAETGKVPLNETQTKGKKARPAWVTPRCLEAFAALPRIPGNPYVFASRKSKRPQPLSKAAMWRHYKATALRAGLQPRVGDGSVHAHDGRRGFATKLIKGGAHMHKVQKLLGHASIATTEWYVDMEDEDLEDAHSVLATARRRPASKLGNPPDPGNTDTKK